MAGNINLIAVFCAAEIPPNLLTSFLDEAYGASGDLSYALATSDDLTSPLAAARPPVQNAVKTPGIEVCADAAERLGEFEGNTVDPRYFVVLDEHSLQPERGCLIGDQKSESYVRCEFGVSLLAVEALRSERKGWPDLWLDAALSGGVISRRSQGSEAQPQGYQSFTDQEIVNQCIQAHQQRDLEEADVEKDQPFAVFVTANVPVTILNELLDKSKSHEINGLCFLNTSEPNQRTQTTTAPLPDNFTSPFLGKDFSYILQFVTDVLPSTSLQKQKFLVVDSFALPSLSSKPSVLHVDTKGAYQNDPDEEEVLRGCFAARESFQTAFNSLLEQVGSMDEFAIEAAVKGGVYDY